MEVDSAFICGSSGISLRGTTLSGSIMSRILELRQQPDLSAIVAKAARAPHRVADCKVSIFQYGESQDVPGKVVMIRPACGN